MRRSFLARSPPPPRSLLQSRFLALRREESRERCNPVVPGPTSFRLSAGICPAHRRQPSSVSGLLGTRVQKVTAAVVAMGKSDFLTPKAIANRIKSKGLQKLRWYCQMCQKQCRDEVSGP